MDIIKLENPYSLNIYLTKYLTTKIALINFIGIIYHIFIRRSITTIIFINVLLLGRSTIKLIKIFVTDFINWIVQVLREDLERLAISTQDAGLMESVKP